MIIKRPEASYDSDIPSLVFLLRLMRKVPSMDRPPRQARHPRISLRGWQAQLQENAGIHVSQRKIQSRGVNALEDATAVCFVREFDPIRDAALLCCAR